MPYRNAKEEAEFRKGFIRGDTVWTRTKRKAVLTRFRKTDGYWDCRYANGEEGILQPGHIDKAEPDDPA